MSGHVEELETAKIKKMRLPGSFFCQLDYRVGNH